MRNLLLSISFSFISLIAFAQFPVGHRQITYQDPARSNRNVTTEIYYPGVSAGESVTTAAGTFPIIVFGHGFMMNYDAYLYIKDAMVPDGYIVIFPTTETGASPSHPNFGLDLAFLVNKLISENTNNASPFYTHVANTSAIMGHSMGGGSSFLACENNTVPTVMVTFAAANTTPPSIAAASNITIPCLVISGAVDCVAPPADHQIPMYDSLASACKVYLSIKNGGHCYFGDYNFACTFGESTCMPTLPITRAAQQDVALDFTKLYLDYYLKGNALSWTKFNDSLTASQRITYQKYCPTVNVETVDFEKFVQVFPNPVTGDLSISFPMSNSSNISITIINVLGEKISSKNVISENKVFEENMNLSNLQSGIYFVEIKTNDFKVIKKIIKE
jgi:pimeloyl-ACP methyl ester carboxylesterase